MTLEGRVLNGTIVLQPPASLPEGASVRVEVLTTEEAGPSLSDRLGDLAGKAVNLPLDASELTPEAPAPTLAKRLSNVIGKAKGLPSDASINMDHYLYGMPKRK
jgi:hypothetical protein